MRIVNPDESYMLNTDVSVQDEPEKYTENSADLYLPQHVGTAVGEEFKNETEKIMLHPQSCDVKCEGEIKTEILYLHSLRMTQSEGSFHVDKSDDGCEIGDDNSLPFLEAETKSQITETVVETGNSVLEDDIPELGEMTLENGRLRDFGIEIDVDGSTQHSVNMELADDKIDNCDEPLEKLLFRPTGKSFHEKCNQSIATTSAFEGHVSTHVRDRLYKFLKHKKSFSQKSDLLSHTKTHSGERQYTCARCEISFTQKSHLLSHRRTHPWEKPYQCVTCGKCFCQISYLSVHERTHTGEKPYQCVFCGKCFSQYFYLSVHERTHTGEKPYKCVTCGKCFSQTSGLLSHTRTHTGEKPYKCVNCGKCFREKSLLLNHTRRHKGEKPYECVTCGKCFCLKSSLSKHTATHTGGE